MIDVNTLDRLRSRTWDDGEATPDYDARRAAVEIDRLAIRLWFWRTLTLVLVVAVVAMAATANAQEVKPSPPGQWTVIPADKAPPTRCNKIGDKTVCKYRSTVQTCWMIGAMLYCKEGY